MSPKTKAPRQQGQTGSDKPTWFDRLSPLKRDAVCIVTLLVIIYILFFKIITSNMIFSDSGDTAAALSWAVAGKHLEDTEKIDPQWFPYVFCGMPSFGSLVYIPRNVNYIQTAVQTVGKLLFLNGEMSWMVLHYFLGGVFMFLLLRYWKFSHLVSLMGAVAFMLSPYAMGLAEAGQGSKLMALSYLPIVVLLTHALFERRDLLSLGLLSCALGTLFLTNHVQMVFYVLFVIGLFLLYEIVLDIRRRPVLMLTKAVLLGIACLVGFALSAYVYFSVHEYAQYSIRGAGVTGAAGGLGYDYATGWSFHPFEVMNLLIPSFFGFRSPYYWGWMPFTESSVYIGIVPIILAVLALIYRRNRTTIFFAVLSVVMFLISFGRHLPILYDLLFNYLPYFNKFRSPVMILHLLPFTFGVLAAYGMAFLLDIHRRDVEINIAKLKKGLLTALIVIAAVLVLGFLAKDTLYGSLSGFMFEKEGELAQLQAQYGQRAPQVLEQLKKARFDLFWSGREVQSGEYLWNGYVRFALISIATLGLILLYLNRKLKASLFSSSLVALLTIDLLIIDSDFIHPKPKNALNQELQADETVKFLKSDTTLYRIFPLGQLFQDDSYMYHLVQSLGGYSPAKIRIYQEMLDSCMYNGWDKSFPLNMNTTNMLNAKYILSHGKLPEDKFKIVHIDQAKRLVTSLNPACLPRAFFVNQALIARDRTEVFDSLNSPSFNPRLQATLEKEPTPTPQRPDTSFAEITSYLAHDIVLETFSDKTALLVLSEIYYPPGWTAYVDGRETEIYKTNYVLRSVVVPAGKHTVEFKYYSATYALGLTVSFMGWGVTAVLIVIGAVHYILRKRRSLVGSMKNTTEMRSESAQT
jgi:hypothetical protein